MKFRITEKDLIMFIIFCIFLLYLCAVIVGNIMSITDGTGFYGISPILGFTGNNARTTILVFVISLGILFASVSSYIFSKEKGKGFGFKIGEKEEKGYSRWANEKEIKKYKDVEKVLTNAPESSAAGVALMNNGKIMYVDNGENHTLVIGATASGKTTAIVDPLVNSLAKKGESMIITDPKGEIYKNHCNYLKSKGYNVLVLNFRDPSLGSAWNPLSLPYLLYKAGNHDKSTELLDDVALNIITDPNSKADPFWAASAADYFAGISLGLFEDADENQINLNTISYMSSVGEEKFTTSNYIKEYFTLKGEDSSAYTFASNTINAPQDTKGSILSVFRQKIRLFASKEDLSEMLSHTDFDLRNIGNEKTAIFMVIHDEKTTYHALATIFIKQCYETLVDFAYKQPNGKLPYRTNFILDEFANMPALKDVTSMVTAARSRSIRFTFIIQNFAQLVKVYGKDDSETIKSNCGNLIYLLTTELAALEEISKLCGDSKAKGKDAEKVNSVPLVSVSDLQRLKMNEAIILKTRLNPFKTKFTPGYKIDWGHKFDKAEFYQRERQPVQLFDLKEFVKEKKRNKLLETMNNPEANEREKNLGNVNNPYPFDMQMPSFGSSGRSQTEVPKSASSIFDQPTNSQPVPTLDEIVKQIDAQIAKLEKEEAESKKFDDNKPAFIDNRKQGEVISPTTNVSAPVVEEPKPIVEVQTPVVENYIEKLEENKIDKIETETIKPIVEVQTPVISEVKQTPVNAISEVSKAIEKIELEPMQPVVEKPVIFTVQEPIVSETIIPTSEDIKLINEDVRTVKEVPLVIEINSTVEEPSAVSEVKPSVEETPVISEIKLIVEEIPTISEIEPTTEAIILPKEEAIKENISEEKPIINIDADSLVVNNNFITDDQFFDDFFSDE